MLQGDIKICAFAWSCHRFLIIMQKLLSVFHFFFPLWKLNLVFLQLNYMVFDESSACGPTEI